MPSDEDVEGIDEFYGTPRLKRVRDYSRDGVLASLEASLERLRLDRVDIALIHDPEGYEREALDEAYPALEELRARGVVGAIGFGMNHAAVLERLVRTTDVDCVLIAGRYSLLDTDCRAEAAAGVRRRGVAVLVGGVFGSGVLADPRPGARYDYAPASAEVLERADTDPRGLRQHGVVAARRGDAVPAPPPGGARHRRRRAQPAGDPRGRRRVPSADPGRPSSTSSPSSAPRTDDAGGGDARRRALPPLGSRTPGRTHG